jgi:hypothetical protein
MQPVEYMRRTPALRTAFADLVAAGRQLDLAKSRMLAELQSAPPAERPLFDEKPATDQTLLDLVVEPSRPGGSPGEGWRQILRRPLEERFT